MPESSLVFVWEELRPRGGRVVRAASHSNLRDLAILGLSSWPKLGRALQVCQHVPEVSPGGETKFPSTHLGTICRSAHPLLPSRFLASPVHGEFIVECPRSRLVPLPVGRFSPAFGLEWRYVGHRTGGSVGASVSHWSQISATAITDGAV